MVRLRETLPGRGPLSPALLVELLLVLMFVALLFVPRWPSGFVMVRSVPGGAAIRTTDGMDFAAPALVPATRSGTAITLRLDGYAPTDTVISPRDSLMVVYLEYLFPLSVSSLPPGASVWIDGAPAGRTPLLTSARGAGRHVVRAECMGAPALSDTVVMAAHRRYSVDFAFPGPAPMGLVFIPGGSLVLGGGPDGPPITQRVEVASFYLGRNEVTNSQFCAFLNSVEVSMSPDTFGRNGMTALLSRLFPGNYPMEIVALKEGYVAREGLGDRPVRGLSWTAAGEYCSWLTGVCGGRFRYRLPSEAEWEYTALAGGDGPWPWGDSPPDGSMLNCSDASETIACRSPDIDDGFAETSPVGSFPPNPWGLDDMAGNVWEWCADWAGGEGAATRGGEGSLKCLRGGSWLSSPEDCRCESRLGLDASLGYPFAGFRVAADEGASPDHDPPAPVDTCGLAGARPPAEVAAARP